MTWTSPSHTTELIGQAQALLGLAIGICALQAAVVLQFASARKHVVALDKDNVIYETIDLLGNGEMPAFAPELRPTAPLGGWGWTREDTRERGLGGAG